ncbi:MAG: polysaccharide deacetylase family protein [Clostridia bacterium]|nr:polysaccharide deacetylase family protein [Clostridia bacterium]
MKRLLGFFLCLMLLPLFACNTTIGGGTQTTEPTPDVTMSGTDESTSAPNQETTTPEQETTTPACVHDFTAATCTEFSTCKLCGKTQGEKKEHDFAPATCTHLKTCRVCGKTRGGALGHDYEGGKCVRCGIDDPRSIKTPGVTRVVCVGDSITAGGYWKKIIDYLGDGYEVYGFGVSGSTGLAAGMDAEVNPLAYIDQKEHRTAMAYNGDAVVIMLGTNDSKAVNADKIEADGGAQYKLDIKALIDDYKEINPETQIFIALPPMCFRAETDRGMSNIDIENLIIPLLREVAAEENAIVIETHDLTKGLDQEIYFPDGCHPSAVGQAVLAKIVADAVREWKEPEAGEVRLRVALTFDDGPHNEWTKKIVDELNKYNYNATFFVVGNRVDGTAYDGGDTMLYAVENGNEIGIHGYTHTVSYETCPDETYRMELSETLEAIREKCPGYEVKMMRPCWGAISDERIKENEYSVIMWSVDPGDWQYKTYEDEEELRGQINAVVKGVMDKVSDGDIIILHDLYESTYEATVIILEQLYHMGYDVMTVSELYGDTLQPGRIYR